MSKGDGGTPTIILKDEYTRPGWSKLTGPTMVEAAETVILAMAGMRMDACGWYYVESDADKQARFWRSE